MAGDGRGIDDPYDQALALVIREKRASIAFIQRHLMLGYRKATQIIERLEAEGVVGERKFSNWRRMLIR